MAEKYADGGDEGFDLAESLCAVDQGLDMLPVRSSAELRLLKRVRGALTVAVIALRSYVQERDRPPW